MEQNDFIKGAVLGGVLGGVAALLLAPKSGKALRDDISDTYVSANKHSKDFVDTFKEQGHKLMDSIHCKTADCTEHCENNVMLIGGAIGSVIGVVAALLLAPQTGPKLRAQLGDTYEDIQEKAQKAMKGFDKTRHNLEDKIDDWKSIFSTIVSKLSSAKGNGHGFKGTDDIIELASLGLRLYDQFQKRR